ncbi:MAG TPA: methyl-accepting chemotaxis protein [Usitatibacter sp.]|jgi:methyl-accepting chemotaxis protein|nr:methyl-accepting chemotaxis protein [Usitatibacter sp.]
MQSFFTPGLVLIAFVGPWGRVLLAAALYATAALLAYSGAPLAAASLFCVATYVLGAIVMWGQIGIVRISRTMERIASGDLSTRTDVCRAGGRDATRMWRSIDAMGENLSSIVKQVNESGAIIRAGAHDISRGYSELSERTEQQASTLEETASATGQLTATVRQNAEGCRRASVLAQEARTIAEAAAESMRRMAGTMDRIEGGSKRVADITGLIESIAFQTNILALNAAVEAANAGEHGRGFAVVAAEVRSLAARCSEAAKEIRGVIAESAQAVGDGGKLADEAGATIERVVSSVGGVSEVIGDIARGSQEQSAGADGIAKAIQQLDDMTQRNAALVEQTGAAARSFEEQAQRLVEAVSLFKIDRSEARDEAISLVGRGIEHLARRGAQAAFRDFENRSGAFVRGDHYLWACDLRGTVLCHPMRPKSRGENHADLRDADGRPFIRQVISIASQRGRGWVDYQWINPVSKIVEPKSTYFERSGDVILLCGIYRHDAGGGPGKQHIDVAAAMEMQIAASKRLAPPVA